MPTESKNPGAARVRHVTVDENASGQRLDNFLSRELKGVPRTRLYRALRKGEVRVNKGRVSADYRLVSGDIVRIPPLRQLAPRDPAEVPRQRLEEIAASVVYEDAGLLVVDKPSGLAVHGGSGLNYGLIEGLRQLRQDGVYLELVHRLDRDTSGLILVAKRPAVLRELHRQLREKHMDKRYLALVGGHWPAALKTVEAPLEKNVLQSGERMVRVSKEGRHAITEFHVLERFERASLLEVVPITGRTHQIRVHARHAGFPLLGDEKYANERSEALTREIGLRRLFLHAWKLNFTLPEAAPLALRAEPGEELETVLARLRG